MNKREEKLMNNFVKKMVKKFRLKKNSSQYLDNEIALKIGYLNGYKRAKKIK